MVIEIDKVTRQTISVEIEGDNIDEVLRKLADISTYIGIDNLRVIKSYLPKMTIEYKGEEI